MTIRYKDGEWYKVRDGFYGQDFLLFAALDGKYMAYLPESLWHRYKSLETGMDASDLDIEEDGVIEGLDPKDTDRGWTVLYDGTQERGFNDILMSALYGNHMIVLQGGTKSDDEKAFAYLSRSPLAKDKYRTAQMYKRGRAVLKNLVEAYSYCLDAASKGYAPAVKAVREMDLLSKKRRAKA